MANDVSGIRGGVVGVAAASTAMIPNNSRNGMDSLSEPSNNMNDGDEHISSHSGLSALLNAVSLQMSTESGTAANDNVENDSSSTEEVAVAPATSKSQATPPMKSEKFASSSSNGRATSSVNRGDDSGGFSHNFPETLMTVSMDPDNANVITWLPDGKYFCLREDLFRERVLPRYFPSLSLFDNFLRELCKWGFTMIDTKRPGIEVFRHPLFRKGDWKRCQRLKYDEHMGAGPLQRKTNYDSPSSASPSPVPPSAMLDSPSSVSSSATTTATSGDPRTAAMMTMRSASLPNIHTHNTHHHRDQLLVMQQRRTSSSDSFKRRLSPTHQESMEEFEAPACYKQRTTPNDLLRPRSQSDDFHGMARHITTEKLQLPVTDTNAPSTTNTTMTASDNNNTRDKSNNDEMFDDNVKFVEQAVRGATHSIVTDAIEALLRDEEHTQRVFRANAEELSKSSLPGLVPISQELFATTSRTTTPPSRRASSASTSGTYSRNDAFGTAAAASSARTKRRASDTNVPSKSLSSKSWSSSPPVSTSSSSPKLSPPSSCKSSPPLPRGKLPARKAMLMKAMREHSESEGSSNGSHSP